MKNKNVKKIRVTEVLLLSVAAALLLLEIFPPEYTSDEKMNGMISVSVTRAIGSLVFFLLLFRFGYKITGGIKRKFVTAMAAFLPALAVAVNNFPIIGFLGGAASVTYPARYVLVYAVESLMIGLFEELAFRGVLYMSLLEEHRENSRQIFRVTVVSSAVFGCIHLFNLFAGESPGSVLLQIGYSFLIGGMCSIVLLKPAVSGSAYCFMLCMISEDILFLRSGREEYGIPSR